ncbi:hypothetical protein J6590_001101 [Homalodisca vitripennis]|nr:hypothetical protein J6590_001101 [Homalodisca vitripennis]
MSALISFGFVLDTHSPLMKKPREQIPFPLLWINRHHKDLELYSNFGSPLPLQAESMIQSITEPGDHVRSLWQAPRHNWVRRFRRARLGRQPEHGADLTVLASCSCPQLKL